MLGIIGRAKSGENEPDIKLSNLISGFSIEVMPRTAAKIESFRDLLPSGTLVYIAHIEGTPIEDMVTTAARLAEEGFPVMPHIPARLIRDRAMLEDWIRRYQAEAGVDRALLLAGGSAEPAGAFPSSMQMLETGLFDINGFKRLHVAGHPEGSRDIDPDGGSKLTDDALRWKQAFSERTDAEMAIVTQFAFEARPVLDWIERIREAGVDLPVHLGVAGPAKLQTLLKFAMTCGVGPSLKVLQKRARDVAKLLLPYEPTDLLADVARAGDEAAVKPVARVHFFPLGGVRPCVEWARRRVAEPAAAH